MLVAAEAVDLLNTDRQVLQVDPVAAETERVTKTVKTQLQILAAVAAALADPELLQLLISQEELVEKVL
jgi:hypothetical protein